jgi:hypothetical protein
MFVTKGLTPELSGALATHPADYFISEHRDVPSRFALYPCRVRSSDLLGGNFHVIDAAGCGWYRCAVFAHSLKVQLDGFADGLLRIDYSHTRGYAARKVRNIRGEIASSVLHNYCVSHGI